MRPVYLDANATTPPTPEVIRAVRHHLEEVFGNPSSPYDQGRRARRAVDNARRQLASLLGCDPDELVFTSGGTEANNHAIKGVAEARADLGRHLVISAVEHPAVSEPCAWLERRGWEVTVLPVDASGRVALRDLQEALRPDTVLVSVMLANNEVGTLQPVGALAREAHRVGALFHCDAAQAVGKVPVRVGDLGVDLLSVAGHKLHAPKGVGALYVRRGLELPPFLHGAGHERGLRAGTENTPGIVGLGASAEQASRELTDRIAHLALCRDRLQQALTSALPEAVVHGHPVHRLPNTLSIGFPGHLSTDLLDAVADQVAASAGAACHVGGVRLSPVLQAMGVPAEVARGTIRLSTCRETTTQDVDRAAAALVSAAWGV